MVGKQVNVLDGEYEDMSFSDRLDELVQGALDNKTTADDVEFARRWAIVRTELEKIRTYVLWIESEEVSNAS